MDKNEFMKEAKTCVLLFALVSFVTLTWLVSQAGLSRSATILMALSIPSPRTSPMSACDCCSFCNPLLNRAPRTRQFSCSPSSSMMSSTARPAAMDTGLFA